MLETSDLVAFAPTVDVERAKAFYGGTLGLTLVHEDPSACVFDANGTTLRVTPVHELTPQGFTILGWEVRSIDDAVRELTDRGVAFLRVDGLPQNELGIWQTPGPARVAWFKDPDGNTLSITQHG
jgi:catechol 2,3-dioxygenase-like lactoylglutathione lyase family enzyme